MYCGNLGDILSIQYTAGRIKVTVCSVYADNFYAYTEFYICGRRNKFWLFAGSIFEIFSVETVQCNFIVKEDCNKVME